MDYGTYSLFSGLTIGATVEFVSARAKAWMGSGTGGDICPRFGFSGGSLSYRRHSIGRLAIEGRISMNPHCVFQQSEVPSPSGLLWLVGRGVGRALIAVLGGPIFRVHALRIDLPGTRAAMRRASTHPPGT